MMLKKRLVISSATITARCCKLGIVHEEVDPTTRRLRVLASDDHQIPKAQKRRILVDTVLEPPLVKSKVAEPLWRSSDVVQVRHVVLRATEGDATTATTLSYSLAAQCHC